MFLLSNKKTKYKFHFIIDFSDLDEIEQYIEFLVRKNDEYIICERLKKVYRKAPSDDKYYRTRISQETFFLKLFTFQCEITLFD